MTIRKCWTAVLCLGLMTFLGGSCLWAAGPERQQVDEVKARMLAEGWTQITEGVYERQLGPTKVEHLGFGREGLSWMVGDLHRKLKRLQKEYERYPSKELARIIADLTIETARTQRALWNMDSSAAEGPSNRIAAITGPSCSNICYGATADAYYLTSTQGVAAVADAKFNSTCGYSGDTYAYAYARATLNGTTTTVTQSDPQTGTSKTSHAVASVNGESVSGIPCYSEASAYAQSSALGIHYATSDSNSTCPVPPTPCTVTITGTSSEYFINTGCRSRTWSASVSGCTATSYQWTYNGTVVGTGSTYTRNVCASNTSFTLGLSINGGAASDTHVVSVYYEPCECCNTGQICP